MNNNLKQKKEPFKMFLIGIPLGIFIGTLSGYIFLLILRTGFKGTGLKHISTLLGELTALVTFSLGGSWFANGILKGTEPSDIQSPYILAFAVTFFILTSKCLYRVIVKLGNEIGAQKEIL